MPLLLCQSVLSRPVYSCLPVSFSPANQPHNVEQPSQAGEEDDEMCNNWRPSDGAVAVNTQQQHVPTDTATEVVAGRRETLKVRGT